MTAPVEAPFVLLEKPVEIVRLDAVEAADMALGLVPEILDSGDVRLVVGDLFWIGQFGVMACQNDRNVVVLPPV